jgi:Na+-driven multidrug efflux pump
MPGTGFATAATTLVGQNLGAERPADAESSAYESCRAACLFTGAMGLILFVFPEFLMRIYTSDPEIIRLGAVYLRITAVVQVPTAMGFVFPGALRGAGDTRFVLIMTVFAVWFIRLGVSHLMVDIMNTGVAGAWLAMAADWIFRGIASWLWFRAGGWKKTIV